MSVANPEPSQRSKKGLFESGISVRAAAVVVVAVVLVAVVIFVIPRLQAGPSQEASPQFAIISKSEWWTKDEIPDGIGGDSVLHVKVTVKNSGDAAGVCGLNVKVEEPDGRFWLRYRFISISPGATIEEQVDFPEVIDENVEYSAWLTYP